MKIQCFMKAVIKFETCCTVSNLYLKALHEVGYYWKQGDQGALIVYFRS
jgi:hypothetical protein